MEKTIHSREYAVFLRVFREARRRSGLSLKQFVTTIEHAADRRR
jgi:hypothetical protein